MRKGYKTGRGGKTGSKDKKGAGGPTGGKEKRPTSKERGPEKLMYG